MKTDKIAGEDMKDTKCSNYATCLEYHGGREQALDCENCKMKLIIKEGQGEHKRLRTRTV